MKRALRRATITVVALAALATGVGMCSRVGQRGRYAMPYSSYGSGPEGTRGLFLLAETMGPAPERITRDFAALPAKAMLVAFGGCDLPVHREVRRYEAEALEAWIDGGGVLLVAGATGYLPEAFGLSLRRPAMQCGEPWPFLDGLDDEEAEADEAGEDEATADDPPDEAPVEDFPLAADFLAPTADGAQPRGAIGVADVVAGLVTVPMVEPARIVLEDGVDHEVLFEIGGEPAGVVARRGRGAVIVLSSATPFQNEQLGVGLGGVLLYRLRDHYAPGAPILFDEYHLGVGASRSIVQYLRSLGVGPAILQLLFVVGLLLFRLGARFGRPRAEARPRAGGSETYVDAIGSLYARTGDRAGVLATLRRAALERVARHHRADAREASALAAEVGGRLSERSLEAIRALEPEEPAPKSDRGLVEKARALDALVAEAIEGE